MGRAPARARRRGAPDVASSARAALTDDLVLRRAGPADADALADVLVEGMATYRSFAGDDFDPGHHLEAALGFAMRLSDSAFWCLVAEEPERGRAAGEVSFMPASAHHVPVDDPELAHLTNLFVRPERWGSGLARRLLARAVTEAASRGYGEMRLFTPVLHARARRFYEREGWTPRGEPFVGMGLEIEILEYRRPLP